MGSEGEVFREWKVALAPRPSVAPLYLRRDKNLTTHSDDSVKAVYFGFVATAILISMFIVMAIFEKFIRKNSPEVSPPRGWNGGLSAVEAQSHVRGLNSKLGSDSPKGVVMSLRPKVMSVVMPGDGLPKFIAHPAPLPTEHVSWPSHQL
ncbi:hypothetical protein F511_15062 [Dorcoceras hygrometricum]|uniref:Uncharacterized protein n=1 Tax=Dorcoceras hygrometricum TaxID=472368 RepID=A0A2Z7BR93_9LAMI|nr:hypothetical protein F511_15062 [Dorcoceras hygrometricum]